MTRIRTKVLYKKYESFSPKTDFACEKARGSSWIYLPLYIYYPRGLETVILLPNVLFGNLVPCVAAYGGTPKLLEIVMQFIRKSKNLREYSINNESWLNKKTENVWHLLVCAITAVANVFEMIFVCRHQAVLMGFHICYMVQSFANWGGLPCWQEMGYARICSGAAM